MPFTIPILQLGERQNFDPDEAQSLDVRDGQLVSTGPPVVRNGWTPNVYAGTKLHAVAHIVNDAEDFSDLTGAKLAIELSPAERNPIVTKTIDLPTIPYYAAVPVPVDLDIPAAASGDFRLHGRIIRDGKSCFPRTRLSPSPLLTRKSPQPIPSPSTTPPAQQPKHCNH